MTTHARSTDKIHILRPEYTVPRFTLCGKPAPESILRIASNGSGATCHNCLRAEASENRRRAALASVGETLYKVTRWCCSSGLCIDCHARGNHGDLSKRARVVQDEGIRKEYAEKVVIGWARLDAQMEVMP